MYVDTDDAAHREFIKATMTPVPPSGTGSTTQRRTHHSEWEVPPQDEVLDELPH